jgi:hypothetical protein
MSSGSSELKPRMPSGSEEGSPERITEQLSLTTLGDRRRTRRLVDAAGPSPLSLSLSLAPPSPPLVNLVPFPVVLSLALVCRFARQLNRLSSDLASRTAHVDLVSDRRAFGLAGHAIHAWHELSQDVGPPPRLLGRRVARLRS